MERFYDLRATVSSFTCTLSNSDCLFFFFSRNEWISISLIFLLTVDRTVVCPRDLLVEGPDKALEILEVACAGFGVPNFVRVVVPGVRRSADALPVVAPRDLICL